LGNIYEPDAGFLFIFVLQSFLEPVGKWQGKVSVSGYFVMPLTGNFITFGFLIFYLKLNFPRKTFPYGIGFS
jgi:hypothetical protein